MIKKESGFDARLNAWVGLISAFGLIIILGILGASCQTMNDGKVIKVIKQNDQSVDCGVQND